MKNTLRLKLFVKSLLALMVFTQASVFAQPAIQWQKTIGSSSSDELASMIQTNDGGYVLTGTGGPGEASGDRSEPGYDFGPWIVKLQQDGAKEWDDLITYTADHHVTMSVQTADGGFALLGYTEVSASILKLDAKRNVQWFKNYFPDNELGTRHRLEEIRATNDGGIILAASSNMKANPPFKDENSLGDFDYLIVKFSKDGAVQWNNTIGGSGRDICSTIQLTADGGYIIAGSSESGAGFDKTEASVTGNDMWIVKLDSNGVVKWDKTIPKGAPTCLVQSSDGGYLVGGSSTVNSGGDKSEDSKGGLDMWVVKLNSAGSTIWNRTIGGTGDDELRSILERPDGSIILGGQSYSGAGGDKTEESRGLMDLWIVKLDALGKKVWDKTLGGSDYDYTGKYVLIATADGGFSIGSTSMSNASGDKTEDSKGYFDYWVVKFAPENLPTPQTPIRINAGGPAFTTATKKLFIADKYYAGIDRVSSVATGDISNTSNDILYQSARCSPSFSYNIPVPNGEVTVYLHFAETYFGAPGKKGGKGSRQFHVNMEGVRKLTNYDIFAKAGGAMLATAETFTVNVTDGMLNIDFLTGAADLPRVSAIEVLPSPQRTLTFAPEEDATVRDGIYQNQNFGSDPLLSIKGFNGTPRDLQRVSYLKFAIPGITNVKSAKLRVYGKNYENMEGVMLVAGGVLDDSWTENGITKANAPSALNPAAEARVQVNSEMKYRDLDVTEFVRSQAAGDKVVSLTLSTGSIRLLNFHSKENPSGFAPQLVIVTDNTANQVTRLGSESEEASESNTALSSVIYPNPAKDHIMLEVSSGHKSEVDLELTNMAGMQFQLQRPETEDNSTRLKVGLPGQLQAGMYLLKVQSREFSEVLKVLVTE